MINVEVFEPDDNNPNRTIYYRDSDDIVFRIANFDKDGNLLTDLLTEFNQSKQALSDVIYSSDSKTVLSYREYQYNNIGEGIGFSDYKIKEGVLKKLCSTERIIIEKGKKVRINWYNAEHKFVFYELFTWDEDFGMINDIYLYDVDDKPFRRAPFPLETFQIY